MLLHRRLRFARPLSGLLLGLSVAIGLVGVLPAIANADSQLIATPGGMRTPPPPFRRPHACAYHDVTTKLTSYNDALTTLVDTT